MPQLGTVELWRIRGLNLEHPVHIHLAQFQVLTAGGSNANGGPYNQGWKDTASLNSGGEAELLVKFDGFRGKYVFHCHNLEHEDMMVMANFEVVWGSSKVYERKEGQCACPSAITQE